MTDGQGLEPMITQRYDFIIVGGGAAGLSLAYHLIRSSLRERSILIVDKDAKNQNDRTWCFWTAQPTPFDAIVHRSWSQLQFAGENFETTIDLQPYRYKMIRGIDFYRFVRQALSAHPNVEFLQGSVDRIDDGADRASVSVDTQTYTGSWVFDSRFRLSAFAPDPSRYHYIQQHFQGWEIETPGKAFNPQAATLLDFRTPQQNEIRFFYVLPFSERHALVEYVVHTAVSCKREERERALQTYLETVMRLTAYRILAEEHGVNPLTDQPFPRRAGRHIMTIGTLGGRVKPSTGYAFLRIQQDSAAIVESLQRVGHPFSVPSDSRRYRFYDSLMLQIMSHHSERIKPIFTALFKKNPIQRVFRFLDETAPLWENLVLIPSLPPALFLQAAFRLEVLRRV
jgi:lycopene beta-cyclase